MHALDGRLDVKLKSRVMLVELMDHYRFTTRSFAEAVNTELARTHRTLRKPGKPMTTSKTAIGYLRSGDRRTIRKEVAQAIEVVLRQDPGVLFVPKVLHADRDTRQLVA